MNNAERAIEWAVEAIEQTDEQMAQRSMRRFCMLSAQCAAPPKGIKSSEGVKENERKCDREQKTHRQEERKTGKRRGDRQRDRQTERGMEGERVEEIERQTGEGWRET